MNESILILGAAALQLPLINFVKSKGYRVIVVSIPGDYPGFRYADRSIYCDIRDGERILSLIGDENIVAVMTDQTDISVPTVAYLNKKLGLSGNAEHVAQIYSNKNMMRHLCDKINVPNLHHIRISNISDAKDWTIYPAMLKPEDSQGSRGVYKVNSSDELSILLDSTLSFSHSGFAILEEFFDGHEIVVEGYVQDGEYINFGIGDRKYFSIKDKFIPSQTIFPSLVNESLLFKIIDNERKIHKHISPSFGMIHSEYLVNEETGEFYLIETALRGGGVYISSHLIPLYTGFNNYELLLGNAIGNKCNLIDIKNKLRKESSAYVCFNLPEGVVYSIDGLDVLRKCEGVEVIELSDVYVGKQVGVIQNKTHRFGPILLHTNNRSSMEDLIFKIQNILSIKMKTPTGDIKPMIW